MSLYLSFTNISKSYGFHQVLKEVSLVLNAGERIGLVGANGVGKSTLLKIITGEIEADSGTLTLPAGLQIGYLAQVITDFEGKTIDELIAQSMNKLHTLESQMRQLEARMTTVGADELGEIMLEYGEFADQFERYGGYEMDYRVDSVLDGLRIGHISRDRQFSTLSGGEKARVGLAILLLQSPDVLLLDEPTNHLDFASLEWLEDYLRAYRGGILIVSHDRHFLNRTVSVIVEIDEHTRTAKRYVGDYDAYHKAKMQERRKWVSDYANQQEEIKVLRIEMKETAHRNNNYRAHKDNDKYIRNDKIATHDKTVAKRIHAAEERLNRILENPIPQPPDLLRFEPEFDPQLLKSRVPLSVSNLSKHYGERTILEDVTFSLDLNSRVVLVGPNGAGKSTLLKILLGLDKPDCGEVYLNPGVRIGYLAQEHGMLDPDKTAFEAYQEGLPGHEQQLMAMILRSGLFRYDELGKRVRELSSGQQRKLQIARLMAGKANLLVLDEPTNYVSFDVLEGLEDALRQFPGPIIAASHDRRFIEQFNGGVWMLENGRINLNSTIGLELSAANA
jgi:macrolide transport system ATP-binding/permease protein